MNKSSNKIAKKSSKLTLLLGAVFLYPLSVFAAITPYIIETKTLHFGDIIFIAGSCQMAYDTQVITNLTPQKICSNSTGTVGKYQVFANPNKLVQIKIKSHHDTGNGIVYVPSGELDSDFQTTLFIADINHTINSGTSGIIDITIGGRLTINNMLSSSSVYSELFEIEFIEL